MARSGFWRGVSRVGEWGRPFETLRKKWVEVPIGLESRAKTVDLLALPDAALLDVWTKARHANTTGEGFSVRGWYHALYAEALRDKKVLDVGCGLGLDSVTFAQHGAKMTFLDIAEPNIGIVRRVCRLLDLKDVKFLVMEDTSSLNVLEDDYDVIMAIGSLHHAPSQVIRQEAHAVLGHLKVGAGGCSSPTRRRGGSARDAFPSSGGARRRMVRGRPGRNITISRSYPVSWSPISSTWCCTMSSITRISTGLTCSTGEPPRGRNPVRSCVCGASSAREPDVVQISSAVLPVTSWPRPFPCRARPSSCCGRGRGSPWG